MLPVYKGYDRKLAYEYFRQFLKGNHGRVIFIENGRFSVPELIHDGKKGTIVLVDLSSAAVIDKRSFDAQKEENRTSQERKRKPLIRRVTNPGVNFLEKGEIILPPIDLRTQVRSTGEFEAVTWDKIQLTTSINVVFTVGQPAEELLISIVEKESSRLRILKFSDSSSRVQSSTQRKIVTDILDENTLSQSDRAEVQINYRKWKSLPIKATKIVVEAVNTEAVQEVPYKYDSKRIESASFSAAVDEKDNRTINWIELVTKVVQDRFKLLLSNITYDDLYDTSGNSRSALAEFKLRFSIEVKNLGVLSYRFVERLDGKEFQIGDEWKEEDINVSDHHQFSNNTILRNYGVKIISVGFSELQPSEPVRRKLANYWKARLKKASDIQRAQKGLESMEIKRYARSTAQLKAMVGDEYDRSEVLPVANQLADYINRKTTDPQVWKLLSRNQRQKLYELLKWLKNAIG